MNIIPSHIERRVEEILNALHLTEIPINLEKCAHHLNISVKAVDLDDDVAGFLLIKDSQNHIGYNKSNGKSRVRFTIAHEIGHFVLHTKDTKLFVDKKVEKIIYRNSTSSTGEIIQEREANAFAAALLMPQRLIIEEIKANTRSSKNEFIKQTAKRFQVSEQALTLRLINLGLIDYDSFDT